MAAAAMLDAALERDEQASTVERTQALVFRAGLAITLGDRPRAQQLLAILRELALGDAERAALVVGLKRAVELEQMLRDGQ